MALFFLSTPAFFLFSGAKGFERVAARQSDGSFIESYAAFQRQRQISHALVAMTAATIVTVMALTTSALLPRLSRANPSAVDTLTVCSTCAYTTIQSAIDATDSNGDIVQIQDGTYNETQIVIASTDPAITLRGNTTVVSALLNGDENTDLNDGVTINGFWSSAYHGRLLIVRNNSTIEGIIFKGGGSNTSGESQTGGAIYVDGASPTIQWIYAYDGMVAGTLGTFVYYGGAIHIRSGSPTIENFDLNHNTAGSAGGAIFYDGENSSSYPIIKNGKIHDNSVTRSDSGAESSTGGGAIYILNGAAVVLNVTMTNNQALQSRGAHLYCRNCTYGMVIGRNILSSGKALWGGGIYLTAGTSLDNVIRIENNYIYDNEATGGDGAGIFLNGNTTGSRIHNNTVVHNTIPLSGAPCPCGANVSYIGGGQPSIINNIFAYGVGGLGFYIDGPATANIEYNLFYLNESGAVGGDLTSLKTSDVVADPKFLDYSSRRLRLNARSPAVDKGTTSSSVVTDQEGQVRPVGNALDIGADEMKLALGKIYVDAFSGNDVTGDGSLSSPWRSISAALNNISSANADTIYATSGTTKTLFNEVVTLTSEHAGQTNARTEIKAWTDGGRAAPVFDSTGKTAAFVLQQGANFISLEGLTISRANDHAIAISQATDVQILRSTIYRNDANNDGVGSAIQASGADRLVMSNLVLEGNANGITLEQSPNVQITFNTLHGNAQAGIRLTNASSASLIQNNNITSNGQTGISIDASSQASARLDYNLYDQNGSIGVWGKTTAGSLADWKTSTVQEVSSLAQDPLYLNAAGKDFTLTIRSPGINAATMDRLSIENDLHDNPRPFGLGQADIGAHEFQYAVESVYVHASNGNDLTGNGTSSAPWKTLAQAITYLRPERGDTLYGSGTFTETLVLTADQRGSATASTTLAPWTGAAFAIDGENRRAENITITEASHVTIDHLILKNALADALVIQRSSSIDLSRMHVSENRGTGITVTQQSSDIAVWSSMIHHNGGAGLRMDRVSTPQIFNNTIVLNAGAGILFAKSSGSQVKNNSIAENGSYALVMDASTVSGAMGVDYNNLFSLKNRVGKAGEKEMATFDEWRFGTSLDQHSISVRPRWNSETDVHLTGESPEIDAGTLLALTLRDFDGEVRPQGNGMDIGADERTFLAEKSIYVDAETGNDQTGTGSKELPIKTLNKAITLVKAGGGVGIFASGTFSESFTLDARQSGTAESPNLLTHWPGRSRPIVQANGQTHGMLISGVGYLRVEEFLITGASLDGIKLDQDAAHIELVGNTIASNGATGILVHGGSDITIQNNAIHHNGGSGESPAGIVILSEASDIRVIHNTIVQNQSGRPQWSASGIQLGQAGNGPVSKVTMINNILSGNDLQLKFASQASEVMSDYNLFNSPQGSVMAIDDRLMAADLRSWKTSTSYDDHSVSGRPALVSTSKELFNPHLQPSSAAIDAGGAVDASLLVRSSDLDDEGRPYETSKPDIGADESTFPAVPSEIRAVKLSPTSIRVSWAVAYGSPSSFTIEVSTNGSATPRLHLTSDNPTTISHLQPSTAVQLRVKAKNANGESDFSAPIAVKTDGDERNLSDETSVSSTPDFPSLERLKAPTILFNGTWWTTIQSRPVVSGLTQAGTTVEIWVDDALDRTVTPVRKTVDVATFSASMSKPLVPGEHRLKIRSRTPQGESGFSRSIPLFVFSKAIEEAIPIDPALFARRPVNSTSHAFPLFVGLAPASSRLRLMIDGVPASDEQLEDHPLGTVSFAVRPKLALRNGIHSVRVEAFDASGKRSMRSERIVFRVVDPLPAPTILKTVLHRLSAIIAGVTFGRTAVEVYVDDRLVGTMPSFNEQQGVSEFQFHLPVVIGRHTIYAKARDDEDPTHRKSRNSEPVFYP